MSQLVVHVVTAGDPTSDTLFFPQNTVANVGDVVQFEFKSGNHTASQSIFSSPCIQDESGFVSGFMPISSNSPTIPTFSITINSTEPIYYYSAQGNECQDGVVGGINTPSEGDTLTSYQAAAEQVALSTTSKTSASQGLHTVTFPTTPPSIQTSIKASSTPTSSDTGPTVTVTSPPSPLNKSNGISAGDMAGIAVAAVALLVLGAGLGILWKRKNFLKGSGGRGRVERVVAHTREWKAELDGSARHLREEKQRAWELEGSGRPIGGRARSTIYELPGR